MKYLAWVVALFALAAGVAMIAAPAWILGLRSLVATPMGLLVIACIRIAIGVVLIMSAPATRAPKALQVAGAILLGAGLATPLFGVERTKAVLEWEAMQGPTFMRAIGIFVTALGGVLTFVLTPRKQA
jgi:hypothetical protein